MNRTKVNLGLLLTVLTILSSCAEKEDLIPELKKKPTLQEIEPSIPTNPYSCSPVPNYISLVNSPGFSFSFYKDCDLTNSTLRLFLGNDNYELDATSADQTTTFSIDLPRSLKTGLYKTTSSFFPSANQIRMSIGVVSLSSTVALSNQDVFVEVNQTNQTVLIHFCDLYIYQNSSTSTYTRINGRLNATIF